MDVVNLEIRCMLVLFIAKGCVWFSLIKGYIKSFFRPRRWFSRKKGFSVESY
jgi:hypothetical protein